MRIPALLLVASVLGSCTYGPPPPQVVAAEQAREQAALQVQLAGRVPAGPPMSCLPQYASGETITVSDNIILFKHGGTIYRNDPPGGCTGAGNGFYTLVTKSYGGGLCRGEPVQVVDLSTHMLVGVCTLGDFVPYRKPGSRY